MKTIPPKALVAATQHVLRAVDNPVRLRILAILYLERKAMAYNEIAQRIDKTDNSAVAHHLKVLVGAALVGNHLQRVEGQIRSCYSISESGADWLRRIGLEGREPMRILAGN